MGHLSRNNVQVFKPTQNSNPVLRGPVDCDADACQVSGFTGFSQQVLSESIECDLGNCVEDVATDAPVVDNW